MLCEFLLLFWLSVRFKVVGKERRNWMLFEFLLLFGLPVRLKIVLDDAVLQLHCL